MKKLLQTADSVAEKILSQSQYEMLIDFRDDLQSILSKENRHNATQIQNFKNKHQGKRCFIIGNGPSLNRTDLSKISGEYTFGLNRIYLLFDKINFVPSYYICTNPYVIEQSWTEIEKIAVPKFLGRAGMKYFAGKDDVFFLRSLSHPRFSYNPARGVWEGATVTFVAMQVAYYMGFREIVLLGVDHYFKAKGNPHALVVSEGADPDHFSPDYFGKGVKWQLPDLATSEIAYKMAKDAFEQHSRRVVDATINGRLSVFPKVSFDEIIETKSPS
ncbi:MAG: DUF115 domain-containing protein [Anaerolineae bacterium]|nr:DUF115 domain-containing protein [Anaerolineae bacterium]